MAVKGLINTHILYTGGGLCLTPILVLSGNWNVQDWSSSTFNGQMLHKSLNFSEFFIWGGVDDLVLESYFLAL